MNAERSVAAENHRALYPRPPRSRRGFRFTRSHKLDPNPWPGRWQVSPNVATSRHAQYGQRIFDVGVDVITPARLYHWNLRWWGRPKETP